jgi:hypothetical protein
MENKSEPLHLEAAIFIKLLQGNLLDDKTFESFYILDDGRNLIGVKIQNIVISEPVIIDTESPFRYPINIFSGQFERFFIIKNAHFKKDFTIRGGEFNSTFKIENGVFAEKFEISDQAIFSNFFILSNPTFESSFNISGGKFKNHFLILNGNYKNGFCIYGGQFSNIFTIANGLFNDPFYILGGTFRSLEISGGVFKQGMRINNTIEDISGEIIDTPTFKGGVEFSGGEFLKNLYIDHGNFNTRLAFTGGHYQKTIFIRGGRFRNIDFANVIVEDNLHFKGGFISKTLVLGGSQIKQVFFNEQSDKDSKLFIDTIEFKHSTPLIANLWKLHLNTLRFINGIASKDTMYRIRSISINTIEFNTFDNLGYITWKSLRPAKERYEVSENLTISSFPAKSKFIIKNSDLGKSVFIDSALDEFDEFKIESSRISDVFISGDFNPNKINQTKGKEVGEKNNRRLVFAQLKKIFENKGDNESANSFLAMEMNEYFSSLSWRNRFPEKLNLFLNKYSSNHGENLKRSFLMTLIISCLLYILYCYELDLITLNGSWECDPELISYFPEFFLPTHKLEFMKEYIDPKNDDFNLNQKYPAAVWIDGVSRIVISYLIYQFIQTFRKHGKKRS